MKKVLLTTSALTLIAGAAFADVSLSGSARINIQTNAGSTPAHKALVSNRARLNVKLSGQSDGGLSFGASTRLQTTGGAGGSVQGATVFVSNGAVKLSVGNTDGAIASTIGMYAVGGCGWSASNAYGNYCANVLDVFDSPFQSSSSGGAGPQVARVDFGAGPLKLSASTTLNNTTGVGTHNEVALSYSAGGFGVSVGANNKGTHAAYTATQLAALAADGLVAATYTGGTYATLSYGNGSGLNVALTGVRYKGGANQNGKTSAYILKAGMPVGGGNASVFVANDAGGNRSGVNYKYSLGGGASVIAAVTHSQHILAGQRAGTNASFGMTFKF